MTPQSRPAQDRDPVHSFPLHAAQIVQEAQFIIDSMPNVEDFSVERALRQLHAVHYVLVNMEDEWLEESELDGLIDTVVIAGLALEHFQNTPPPSSQRWHVEGCPHR
jgi:hypothetical protein